MTNLNTCSARAFLFEFSKKPIYKRVFYLSVLLFFFLSIITLLMHVMIVGVDIFSFITMLDAYNFLSLDIALAYHFEVAYNLKKGVLLDYTPMGFGYIKKDEFLYHIHTTFSHPDWELRKCLFVYDFFRFAFLVYTGNVYYPKLWDVTRVTEGNILILENFLQEQQSKDCCISWGNLLWEFITWLLS